MPWWTLVDPGGGLIIATARPCQDDRVNDRVSGACWERAVAVKGPSGIILYCPKHACGQNKLAVCGACGDETESRTHMVRVTHAWSGACWPPVNRLSHTNIKEGVHNRLSHTNKEGVHVARSSNLRGFLP